MRLLARQIANELQKVGHCGVYEPELSSVWPHIEQSREAEIARFVKEHGWRLGFYKEGFCATFDKGPVQKITRFTGAYSNLTSNRKSQNEKPYQTAD